MEDLLLWCKIQVVFCSVDSRKWRVGAAVFSCIPWDFAVAL